MRPLEEMTIGNLLHRTAAQFPHRPALEHQGRVWSYAQLDQAVNETARRLLTWGVQKGQRVGLWCETEPNAILVMYALARLGAVVTMLNTSLQRKELKGLLASTQVNRLIIGDGYKEGNFPALCQNLTQELPGLEGILSVGPEGRGAGYPSLNDLAEAPESALAAAQAQVCPQDTAFLLYTSGTTSLPKAVMTSHYSWANSGIQQAGDLGATETDRFCVSMPIFHCFCLSVNIMAACAAGACLYLPVSRRTTALLEAVSQGHCTVMSSVPSLFRAILCREDFATWDLSSLRTGFIGGGGCTPEAFRAIDHAFGFTLLSSLGQTEATAGITTTSLRDSLEVRATTVGHFMNHVEGRIVHLETGNEQPVGEAGEIWIRGYGVMQGYYGQPEETAQALADGWLHTGDMGYLDAEGNLHLTGRLKELIIRGGENISPAEVERILATDERVAECKAVGVPDPHYGEEVCLCVVLREGVSLPEETLRQTLSRHLADYKLPRYILFFQELPRTPTGKLRLGELKELAAKTLHLNQ